MYGAVDPVYMLMLIKNLGSGYEIWDKAATIRFRKPGRSTLKARFMLDEQEIRRLGELSIDETIDRVYSVDLTDEEGTTCATIEKTIHIHKLAPNKNLNANTKSQTPALKHSLDT
jgi:hypothetical protein